MKYRVIRGLIGASMIMASLSGCDSVKKTSKETELQSIEIEEMALVVESESEVKDEVDTVSMELDLSDTTAAKTSSSDSEQQ